MVITWKNGEEEGGWCSRVVREMYEVGVCGRQSKAGLETFNSRIRFRMGNEQRVEF